MSVPSAKDFLQRIETDKNLKDRLEAAPNHEARQRIIRSAGFDFTLEEFKQAVNGLADAAGQELTPEDLEKIAGGSGRAGWCSNKSCSNYHCSCDGLGRS